MLPWFPPHSATSLPLCAVAFFSTAMCKSLHDGKTGRELLSGSDCQEQTDSVHVLTP